MTPNAEQLRAIYGGKGKTGQMFPALRVIIAGAGSGKTFTLTECVKFVAPMNVIAVMTFTNGAAHVLRERLGPNVDLSYIGTTHGYCHKLLQRYGELIGYRSGEIVILPKGEQEPRMLAVRDRLGIKITKENLFRPNSDLLVPTLRAQRLLIEREYQFLLKRNNLVDFDMVLQEGLALLQLDEVRAATKLDFLFVDERQDSNGMEHCIYATIPAVHKFFVADPDQSLYEWRGAQPQGIVDLANMPGVDVVTLETNYRSDIRICEAANRLIAHNKMRVPKELKPVSKDLGAVVVRGFDDTWQELEYIGTQIRVLLVANADASIAVLCRTNFEVKRVHTYLQTASLPVSTPVLGEFRAHDWERATLLLSLAVSPDNEILAERYLRLDNDVKQVERWRLEAQAEGSSVAERVAKIIQRGNPDAYVVSQLYRAATFQFLAANGVSESTVHLIRQRAELLPPDANLSDLVRDLYQHDDFRPPENEKGIHCGTFHSAKGCEWDVVFLPAFEQGIIPHIATSKNEMVASHPRLEEERRLAFVALTRARHIVYITHAAVRQGRWGPPVEMQPSQFIGEMGL